MRAAPAVANAFILIVVIAESTLAATGAATTCSELPRPHMTVRLTVNSEAVGEANRVIRAVVDEVWQREGIELSWAEPTSEPTWNGIDLWVVVQHGPISFADRKAVGSVVFSNDGPRPLVRISIDAATDWVRRGFAARHGVPELQASRILVRDIQPEVRLTLAYAVAHEIGHFVTAHRGHSRTGLMQANLRTSIEMSRGAQAIRLDEDSRHRLADRLATAAQCARP